MLDIHAVVTQLADSLLSRLILDNLVLETYLMGSRSDRLNPCVLLIGKTFFPAIDAEMYLYAAQKLYLALEMKQYPKQYPLPWFFRFWDLSHCTRV